MARTLGDWMAECGGRIYDETGYAPPRIQALLDQGVEARLAPIEAALTEQYGEDVFDADEDADA